MTDLELLRKATPLIPGTDGEVIVDGKQFRYRLHPDKRTEALDKKTNQYLGSLCIQFYEWCPHYDRVIAEYILIKNDEERYLQTANLSGNLLMYLGGAKWWVPYTIGSVILITAGTLGFLLLR